MRPTTARKFLSDRPSEEALTRIFYALIGLATAYAVITTLGFTPMDVFHALPDAFRHVMNVLIGKESLGDNPAYLDPSVYGSPDGLDFFGNEMARCNGADPAIPDFRVDHP